MNRVYTRDDFTEGYAFEQFINTKFDSEMERMCYISNMKTNAKLHGIGSKDFDKLLLAAESDAKRNNFDVVATPSSDFGIGIIPIKVGRYICTKDGIALRTREGDMMIIPHPLWISKRLTNVETDEVRLQLSWYNGMISRRVFPRATIANNSKITDLANYGIMVNSNTARATVDYISEIERLNNNTIVQENCIGHVGWIDNNYTEFAPYCQNMNYDESDTNYGKVFRGLQQPKGSVDSWIEVISQIRKSKRVPARAAIAASFAAPLVKPLGALCFIVHLHGDSGCGKTVALHVAASVYGNPLDQGWLQSWNGTKVGRQAHAAFCNSVPVLIDEAQVNNQRFGVDESIYTLCEGIGRAKGKRDGGTVHQKKWQTVIISTGENALTDNNSGAGAIARVLDIEFGGKDIFDDPRSIATRVHDNYGHAGKIFVQWLCNKENMDKCKAWYAQFSGKMPKGTQDKQIMAASVLLTADKAYTECFGLDGDDCLRVEDLNGILANKADIDVNARALEWLFGFVSANNIRFTDNTDVNRGEVWGTFQDEGNKIFINSTIMRRQMNNAGFKYDTFVKWADRNGMLQREDDKHMTVRKTLGECKWTRCMCIITRREQTADDAVKKILNAKDEQMPFH